MPQTTQGGSYPFRRPVLGTPHCRAPRRRRPTDFLSDRGNAFLMGCRRPRPPGALFRESRRVMVALAQRLNTQPLASGKYVALAQRLNTQPLASGKHAGSVIASRRDQHRAQGCSPLIVSLQTLRETATRLRSPPPPRIASWVGVSAGAADSSYSQPNWVVIFHPCTAILLLKLYLKV